MNKENRTNFLQRVIKHMPTDWVKLTTHRLDIYNEELAKVEFLDHFVELEKLGESELAKALQKLPTAFDYIRLGHPLSCILEWCIAKEKNLHEDSIITFSSKMMPVLAILRKNLILNISTKILYKDELPSYFDTETLRNVYGHNFELIKVSDDESIKQREDLVEFEGSTILLTDIKESSKQVDYGNIDFLIYLHQEFGSIALVNSEGGKSYISEILHVRRRESVAMTPNDCMSVLCEINDVEIFKNEIDPEQQKRNKNFTLKTIQEITNTSSKGLLGSCGLSMQYAITMGLIEQAKFQYPGKQIKLIVPPNCYGGTNDQARRVATCLSLVDVLDLPVDGGKNMVQSVNSVLDDVAKLDGIPLIIAEIPTNPRVEVPELKKLREVLGKKRLNENGEQAVAPVFILDQTFCPNVKFLGEGDIFSGIKTISYVSGSKFPSGGLCTAGYCVANKEADSLMSYIESHLKLNDNEATAFQIDVLAKQMPSMLERITDAYKNTRAFVNHIIKTLPGAKINFVSEELAQENFTPSVFSLDLPSRGDTAEQRENYKRELNLKLINMMISEIPQQSKHCVSYGQLVGCYWTIPATSTQGTTKEKDKDYIVRVSIAPNFDLESHCDVFTKFCERYI